jgi:hypothetical protein
MEWPGTLVLALMLNGCGSLQPSAEELNDPARSLQVEVRSVPSGAAVYGIRGDTTGTFCGTTPFTFKYVMRKAATGPRIYGTIPEETITDEGFDLRDPFRSSYSFQCLVVMEGYEPYRVDEVLDEREQFNPRELNTSDVFRGGHKKTITAILIPLSSQ